eukprot:10809404-Karenia_brevis.AAC.1
MEDPCQSVLESTHDQGGYAGKGGHKGQGSAKGVDKGGNHGQQASAKGGHKGQEGKSGKACKSTP